LTNRPSGVGRHLYFDTEGNGLWRRVPAVFNKDGKLRTPEKPQITALWCIGAVDIHTNEEFYFGVDQEPGSGHTMEDGYLFLTEAAALCGHNAIGFDYKVLRKFGGPHGYKDPALCWDSMVTAKLIWPADALIGPDMKLMARGQLEPVLVKRHSLKAWGQRLGELKDEYKGGFEAWNQEMADYMMQDCRAGLKLWRLCLKRLGWEGADPGTRRVPDLAMEIEHGCAAVISDQEDCGVRFDLEKARKLAGELKDEQLRLEAILQGVFGKWWAAGKEGVWTATSDVKRHDFPDITRPRVSEKTGKPLKPYVGPPLEHHEKGAKFTRVEYVTFSASNRNHLGKRLQEVYGWRPQEFTEEGAPKVDETVLEDIPESVVPKEVTEAATAYFKVTKMLGMLAVGPKAWLNLVLDDGRIYGKVDPSGTVTYRGSHRDPNLGQVPKVQVDKVTKHPVLGIKGGYGYECRDLFIADEGWELTGVDMSSLELIDLGHYLWRFDKGVFSARVCDPDRDPHTEHAEITGLSRNDTKTCTYLYVYGGSAWKLTFQIDVKPEEIADLLAYKGLPMLLANLKRRFGEKFVEPDDKGKALLAKARQIILAFEQKIEGLKLLKDAVTKQAERDGFLIGMDGRRLFVRKPHAALNTLLQSAGAISCKLWMILVHRHLREAGLVLGDDYKQVLWVHDELQITHKPEHRELIRRVCLESAREAGEMLGLRGAYRGEAKTGHSWAETH
jgi:DNA polymerase I-like protein with 3'-5' exonuclease and polymerase domains